MREFADELRACLAELGTFDADSTFIAPGRVVRESAPRRARARRPRWPIYLVLALLAAAAITAGVLALTGSEKPAAKARVVNGAKISVHAVASYDPRSDGGDGSEHDTGLHSLTDATDGDPATYWSTDHYNSASFGRLKPGVGLVVDAGRAAALKSLTVTTDTPGFTAKIQTGSSASGPFADDSGTKTVTGTTAFALHGTKARYYLIWLTSLPPGDVAHVNQVKAAS